MAALCESFTLRGPGPGGGSGPGPGPGLCLEPGPGSDLVLLTERGRAATLFKISDQKPLGCWSVKHGQILTCPVVCNFETHEYIAVHDDKVLRIWKNEDMNLDKAFKATLSADVYRIHSLPQGGALVLFRGGAVRTLDVLLEAPQQEIENLISAEAIRWSGAFMEGQQPVLIFTTEKDRNFFVYVQKPKLGNLHKYKLEQQGSAKPLCFTAHITNQTVTLLCLYSNNSVYQVLIPLQQDTEEEEEKEEEILSKSLLLNLSVSGAVLKGTSLVVLDKDHIAVLGSLPEPGKKPKECLTIWNTKFQTLQTSKELPLGTSGQLWCYEEKFFLIHGKVLTVIMYKCETSSLAAAVGKLKDSQTLDVSSFVNWNTLEDEELVVSFQSQESVALKAEARMSLRSNRSTVAGQSGTLSVGQLLLRLKDASNYVVETELKKLMAKAPTPDLQATIGCVVTALTDRCKRNPKFYPQNLLQEIVETRDLSYSLCPDLMAVALEQKDLHLLQMCLERFPDIPEEITYACLKAFLSVSEDHLKSVDVNLDSAICYVDVELNDMEVKTEILENGFSEEMDQDMCDTKIPKESRSVGESCPVGLQKAALLNAVLHSAYTETFLLPHLKNLPAQQAILFLRYLYYLYVKCSEKVNTTLPGIRSPTINQIMDWMCLLLDAQFTVMVMLPEAKDLLSNLHKFVRAQVRFYSELNKIEGSLRELQRLNHLRESQTYSIEVLEII
ncbi:nucleolar protein 11 [Haemorhous mexicanus]|uniref:nucleolar protein 11 n=1 Tax=Haemorhous mexicanus TaxID=30427 RepID=UPI0028BD9251|nr:nucleolar protein 11 [Haemorhous mexicanus]